MMIKTIIKIFLVVMLIAVFYKVTFAQEAAEPGAVVEEPAKQSDIGRDDPAQEALEEEPAQESEQQEPLEDAGDGAMFLNFDNADLVEVINTIGSILEWNYVIDPEITGTVNIHTEGTVTKGDLPAILNTILKVNNVVKVQDDGLINLIPLGTAKEKAVYPTMGSDPDAIALKQNFLIQVVKLKYIRTEELISVIKGYQSEDSDVVNYKERNLFIISDIDSNVKKLMKIIKLFDVDIFKDAATKVFPLKNASAEDVAGELEKIFKVYDYPTNTARGVGISFFNIERINAVLVITTRRNLFEQAEKWINELDKSASENKVGVYIYSVQNVKAENLAGVLTSIFVTKDEDEKEYKKNILKEKKPKEKRPDKTKEGAGEQKASAGEVAAPDTAQSGADESSGMVQNKIKIVTDETTNSIIIMATRKDYKVILETIKKLDVFPKQVLIEVTIAEILLDSRTQFGIEWEYSHNYESGSSMTGIATTRNGAGAISSGLAYVIRNTNKLTTALKASAQDNKVNILSSPRIIASDNQVAKIEIGEDVPLVTSVYRTNDVSSTATTVDQTIQYRSTGIILKVTPRINEAGLVQLEINQEVSEVSEKSVAGIQSPVIYKRSATTMLAVNDSETIIIGGLMKQKKIRNNSGVPFLSKIPIIGYFFSYTSDSVEKTELMILITPRVIKASEDSKRISNEYNKKVLDIKEEFTKLQKKEDDSK